MKKAAKNNKHFSSILLFMVVLLLSGTVVASDELDAQRPDGVNDKKWSSLKTAVQEAKLLPEPSGIGGAGSFFGRSVSLDGNRALVGADGMGVAGAALILDFDGMSWQEVAILQPADGAPGDYFGYSVSLFGDRALVGAYGDDDAGSKSGSAYVFDYDGMSWNQSAKLTENDGVMNGHFGYSVSLSGDRALVGAYGDDDLGSYSGSAYVYDFDGMNWSQSAKLTAADGNMSDWFGFSVSLTGDRALIGAQLKDGGHGSAYVFDFDGINWSQVAKLAAADGEPSDLFGCSVSLSGDRALVGAYKDDDNGDESGSAYVFEFDGMNWSQIAKLTAADGEVDDWYGFSVSLSGDRALVGSRFDDDNGSASGSAYVYDYDGLSWNQFAKLTAADGSGFDYFGESVSLSGDRVLVGARLDDEYGGDSGSAYVFDYDGMDWSQSSKLKGVDGAGEDTFGESVSLFGDRALVGSSQDDDAGRNSGSVYVFDHDGLNWSQSAKLTAADGAAGDWFGESVSLYGDRALVGARRDNDNGSRSGSAYVFDYDGMNWSQSAKLVAVDGAEGDNFGWSVSLYRDRALVGAYLDDDAGSDSGSVYVFDHDGLNWSQSAKLTAADGAAGDIFGYSVSLSGNRALVGSSGDDDNGNASGSVYVFDYDGTNWSQSAKLTATDGAATDWFGRSVSLSGSHALIGAPRDGGGGGSFFGSAYVFNHDGMNWSEVAKLTAAGAEDDYFGSSVSLSGYRALVGSFGDDDNGSASGSAYVYDYDGLSWSQTAKLTAADGAAGDIFGRSVSLSSVRVLVGAPEDNDNGSRSGSAYVINIASNYDDLIFQSGFEGN